MGNDKPKKWRHPDRRHQQTRRVIVSNLEDKGTSRNPGYGGAPRKKWAVPGDAATQPILKLQETGAPSNWVKCRDDWGRHFVVVAPKLGNFLERDDFEIEYPDLPDPQLYNCE